MAPRILFLNMWQRGSFTQNRERYENKMSLVFIRTIIIYIFIIFAIRIMGKRQLGELQPSEFVVTILVSNIATLPLEDTDIPLIGGIIPIITLVALEVLMSWISLKSRKARLLVSGKSRLIVSDGKIDQQAMKELRYSLDDLMDELRAKDIFDVEDVAFAFVQPTGSVSVYPKFQAQPVTAEMMHLQPSPKDKMIPLVVVSDGEIAQENLKILRLTPQWVYNILNQNNKALKQVFLMTARGSNDYKIIEKDMN